MNEIKVTLHGNVVTDPTPRAGRNGSIFTTFRVATTPYRRAADGSYADLETSFYSVIAFDTAASNAAASLRKGQPVIVVGNLSNKSYVDKDGVNRTSTEVEAQHIGHDLRFGRATFQRVSRAAALGADPGAQEDVRRSVEDLIADAERPANVDENGEVHGVVEVPGPPAPEFGDPETDDYEVAEAV
ncbi:MAG: single-stranded DNA-binding protein [Intrasporangium sp.]|uniref:single-stranded DNA-binding protein n=1 Tax=Intrasporangium sp. TaxID=1925024 RepID=UPI003F811208